MKRTYEVGDKVRILVETDYSGNRRHSSGDVGKIVRIDRIFSNKMPFLVLVENDTSFWYSGDELELVEDDEIDTDAIYNEGLSAGERKAWEIMDIIVNKLTEQEVRDIFGPYCCALSDLMRGFSYEEVKEKIEKYMEKKNFKVGDEVFFDDNASYIGVITRMYDIEMVVCSTMWMDGACCDCTVMEDLKKTGRSFPQLVEMLNAMKGKEVAD